MTTATRPVRSKRAAGVRVGGDGEDMVNDDRCQEGRTEDLDPNKWRIFDLRRE